MRTAIDEIAYEPERVGGRIEAQVVEQPLQRFIAALNVPDSVNARGNPRLLRLRCHEIDSRFHVTFSERHVPAFGRHRAFAF